MSAPHGCRWLSFVLLFAPGACTDEMPPDLGIEDAGASMAADMESLDAAENPVATDLGASMSEAGGLPDAGTPTCSAGTYDRVVTFSGADGEYEQPFRLYVPEGAIVGAPVIMQLHGGNGSVERMLDVTGLEEMADVEGFLVVTPFGAPVRPGATTGNWNAGPPFSNFVGVDHVGALQRIVDALVMLGCGEDAPVFVAGQSNGAMMAYRLACEASQAFDGFVVSAGYVANTAPSGETAFACAPERAVPILHIHGLQDPLVAFEGNEMIGQPAIEDDVAEWRMRYACLEPGTDTTDGPVRRRAWSCEGGVPLEFITVADHGHPWAGSPEATVIGGERQGPMTEALTATDELVRFVRAQLSGN